jgi:hypothetical protein
VCVIAYDEHNPVVSFLRSVEGVVVLLGRPLLLDLHT